MTSRASLVGLFTVSWALACAGTAPVEPPLVLELPVVEPPAPEVVPEPVVARPARQASDVIVVEFEPIPEPPSIPTLQAIPPVTERPFTTPVGTATIIAPPPDAAAAKVVARFVGQLRACYEVELVTNAAAAGGVVLAFTVEGGRVTAASVKSADNKPSAAFETCLVGRAKRWSFPLEVAGEQTVGVSFSTQSP